MQPRSCRLEVASMAWCLLLMVVSGTDPRTPSCGDSNVTERFQMLCGPGYDPSSSEDVCKVERKVILPAPWTKCWWQSAGRLEVMSAGSLSCANITELCRKASPAPRGLCESMSVCELHLNFDGGIELHTGSKIEASMVELSSLVGPVTIWTEASIDVSGRGLCGLMGRESRAWLKTRSGEDHNGAGHGGEGGTCNDGGDRSTGQPFGDATDPLQVDPTVTPSNLFTYEPDYLAQYGAGTANKSATMFSGKTPQPECCGGGVIVINTTVGVRLDGQLNANSQSPCTACTLDEPPTQPRFGLPVLPCCNPLYVKPERECRGLGAREWPTRVLRAWPVRGHCHACESLCVMTVRSLSSRARPRTSVSAPSVGVSR